VVGLPQKGKMANQWDKTKGKKQRPSPLALCVTTRKGVGERPTNNYMVKTKREGKKATN
jgi:hypothetical protein